MSEKTTAKVAKTAKTTSKKDDKKDAEKVVKATAAKTAKTTTTTTKRLMRLPISHQDLLKHRHLMTTMMMTVLSQKRMKAVPAGQRLPTRTVMEKALLLRSMHLVSTSHRLLLKVASTL